MASRTTPLLGFVAVGLAGGVVLYASQFLLVGNSPQQTQFLQLLRQLAATGVLGLAAATGYVLSDGADVTAAPLAVLGWALLAGLIGYGLGFAALALAPPARFSIGSYSTTFLTVALQRVVPFGLAGFTGAALRALRRPGRG